MKIAIGSDEKTPLTDYVIEQLRASHELLLYGHCQGDHLTWPYVAEAVAQAVIRDTDMGILFCWSGTGVCMAANKFPDIRAALCTDAQTATAARAYNDANVLVMSLRITTSTLAQEICDAWFSARVDKSELENIHALNQLPSLS